jgi:predicted  nucleic acid-binding Zn-ribbon protein
MEESYSEIIYNIRKKTDLVSEKYLTLLDKYKKLKNEHAGLQEKLEIAEKKQSDLEYKLSALKAAKVIEATAEGKAEARSRIKRLVNEIDRCIALLNVD